MNDTDRILGELKEFKRNTLYELKELRKEMKSLSNFRWKITGSLSIVVVMIELIHVVMQ